MRFFFLTVTSLFFTSAIAQPSLNDTSFFLVSIHNAISQYESAVDRQRLFYNGSSYAQPESSGDSHPFFPSEDYIDATIQYDGNTFYRVPVLFDINSHLLITDSPNGSQFVINPHKLEYFSIQDRYFKFFTNGDAASSLPSSAFYEILYHGNTRLLALYDKNIQEKITGREIEIYFEERTRYFVLKNERYYSVRNKHSILKLFSNQKQALKSLIRKENINFKADKAQALAHVAELYDSLIETGK